MKNTTTAGCMHGAARRRRSPSDGAEPLPSSAWLGASSDVICREYPRTLKTQSLTQTRAHSAPSCRGLLKQLQLQTTFNDVRSQSVGGSQLHYRMKPKQKKNWTSLSRAHTSQGPTISLIISCLVTCFDCSRILKAFRQEIRSTLKSIR